MLLILATMGVLVFGTVLASRISYYRLTGHFSPIQKIETLQNPVAVTHYGSDGLHLADGQTVQLPGLRSLPSNSPALAEATKHGVEVQANGRVWGLVKIHHWCGNDPVREHIARIDLSEMMTFLRVGHPVASVPQAEFLIDEPGGRFTEWGWRIEEFQEFESWEKIKNLESETNRFVIDSFGH